MSSLSIIVPLGNVPAAFEDTLVSVLQNRPPGSEVLVVTSEDYDDPYNLAEEVRLIETPNGCGPIEQINLGFRASRGEVVHLLQSGVEVAEGWTAAALAHFRDRTLGCLAPLVLDRTTQRIVSAGVRWSAMGTRRRHLARPRRASPGAAPARCDGPELLAGFWRKSAWERAGGFDPECGPDYADLDLALTLRALGYRAAFEPRSSVVRSHVVRQSFSAWQKGQAAERLFWKHRRRCGGGLLHIVTWLGEIFGGVVAPRRWAALAGRASIAAARLAAELHRRSSGERAKDASSPSDAARRRDTASSFVISEHPRRTSATRNAVQPF